MRGKLGATLTFDNPEEDHPRGCGENLPIEYNAVPVIGSPPRMRGKLMFEIDSCGNVGITPADAGKTCRASVALNVPPGSPPRMRGKLLGNWVIAEGLGITPADAGKTVYCWTAGTVPTDHPRGCGENCAPVMVERCPSGSPPRMRGKPDDRTVIIGTNGITPADAGKTKPNPSESERE